MTIALLVLLSLLLQVPATAQPSQGRIMTTTRLVTVFSDLESQLVRAVRAKDSAAAEALLADDFDVTVAGAADPVARAEWLRQAMDAGVAGFAIRNLAVRATGDGAVASFQLTQTTGAGATAKTHTLFVVDVWDQPGTGGWKLRARYVAPMATPAAAERRPTGKQ